MLIPIGIFGSSGASVIPAMELISTTLISSTTLSVTFSSIASTYSHLQIRAMGRTSSGGLADIGMTFNGDTGANYSWHELSGNGSTVSSSGASAQAKIQLLSADAAEAGVLVWGATIVDVLDYAKTTKNKTVRYMTGLAGTYPRIRLGSGMRVSTSAITSITLTENNFGGFLAGSRFSLYGIKG